jgi:large subunit ribosomal protein L31
MKKTIHPQTQKVVFQDMATGHTFLVDSTVETADSVLWSDGQTYPLVKVEISSASHSAFTGGVKVETTSTRKEKFDRKFGKSETLN